MKQPWELWQKISTAPCDDTMAKVWWSDGKETIEDLDHDSDPRWWEERGARWWRPLSPDEESKLEADMAMWQELRRP